MHMYICMYTYMMYRMYTQNTSEGRRVGRGRSAQQKARARAEHKPNSIEIEFTPVPGAVPM